MNNDNLPKALTWDQKATKPYDLADEYAWTNRIKSEVRAARMNTSEDLLPIYDEYFSTYKPQRKEAKFRAYAPLKRIETTFPRTATHTMGFFGDPFLDRRFGHTRGSGNFAPPPKLWHDRTWNEMLFACVGEKKRNKWPEFVTDKSGKLSSPSSLKLPHIKK